MYKSLLPHEKKTEEKIRDVVTKQLVPEFSKTEVNRFPQCVIVTSNISFDLLYQMKLMLKEHDV